MAILFHGTTLWRAMNTPLTFPERLRRALTSPTHGVLGLVEDLLAVSREHGLQLDWQAGHCRVRSLEGGPAGWIEVPLRKSVVRAALARVAVLCNVRNPNSVSPYGGQGELLVGTDPATALRVTFVNTPEEQSLELASVQCAAPQQDGELSGGEPGPSRQDAAGREGGQTDACRAGTGP